MLSQYPGILVDASLLLLFIIANILYYKTKIDLSFVLEPKWNLIWFLLAGGLLPILVTELVNYAYPELDVHRDWYTSFRFPIYWSLGFLQNLIILKIEYLDKQKDATDERRIIRDDSILSDDE